jgi:hypothetical protein
VVKPSSFYQWDHAFLQFNLSFLYETCTYTKTLFTFKKFKSRSSIKSRAHYTKNEWPNFDEHTIVMEENE